MRRALELLEKEKQGKLATPTSMPYIRPSSKDEWHEEALKTVGAHSFKRNGSGLIGLTDNIDEGKSTAMSSNTSRVGSGDQTKAYRISKNSSQTVKAAEAPPQIYELSVKAATKKP